MIISNFPMGLAPQKKASTTHKTFTKTFNGGRAVGLFFGWQTNRKITSINVYVLYSLPLL